MKAARARAVILGAGAAVCTLAPATAGRAASVSRPPPAAPQLTLSPSTNLHQGSVVSAVDSGLPPHEAVLFLECTAGALSIGEDGCDNQRNAVRFADDAGVAAAALPVDEVVPTETGPLSCLATTCLLIATDLAHP